MQILVRFTVQEAGSIAGRSLIAALCSGDIRRQLPGLVRGVKEGEASATIVAGTSSTGD